MRTSSSESSSVATGGLHAQSSISWPPILVPDMASIWNTSPTCLLSIYVRAEARSQLSFSCCILHLSQQGEGPVTSVAEHAAEMCQHHKTQLCLPLKLLPVIDVSAATRLSAVGSWPAGC